ncbi:hypothetical protein GGI21_005285 [Coemansia aciculifera]|uniref:Uncharacterized protein n=1 Tax=Coemansia aciculifera TaxID=417176 RepID=A0ACC1M0A8_9FUNG|nr:hypothetical protein IWW38_003732 [Coemansia aciculifera]KAJ2894481.1 hypothetical protein GGI21_005285 [Coemansia aciculifera]
MDEVDLILKHRFAETQGGCEYLVQWSGDLARTWEPSSNLTECQALLSSYWREFSCTARSFEFLSPSFTLVTDSEASSDEEDDAVVSERTKPLPPKKRPAAARSSRPAAEDKIAVAKRVQMNKQLAGARGRAAAAAGSSSSASGGPRRPPPTAKPSAAIAPADFDDAFDRTEPRIPLLVARPKAGKQVARKSTGKLNSMPRADR